MYVHTQPHVLTLTCTHSRVHIGVGDHLLQLFLDIVLWKFQRTSSLSSSDYGIVTISSKFKWDVMWLVVEVTH